MRARLPLLIVAQSGRFIAQSATRAGYPVRVADCFGDMDMLNVAERWHPLPALHELSPQIFLNMLEQLSDGQPCLLVCGTGVESFYPVLAQLPPHITLLGNSPETIARLRQPTSFFALLDKLGLPYPPTFREPPALLNCLVKDLQSAGGSHIHQPDGQSLSKTQFYQQLIDGQSRSLCFIADGKEARILGWNRELNRAGEFYLQQIRQPDLPDVSHQQPLQTAVLKLVAATGLKGFNSLDFIVDKSGHLYLLELNPRITASVELLAQTDWFQWHISACNGHLAVPKPGIDGPIRLLYYQFADSDLTISSHAVWPDECHDLPGPGSHIRADMPVCTFIVEAESVQQCEARLQQVKNAALKNCLPRA